MFKFQEVSDSLKYKEILLTLLDHQGPGSSHRDDCLPGRGHLAQEGGDLQLLDNSEGGYQCARPANPRTAVNQHWGRRPAGSETIQCSDNWDN